MNEYAMYKGEELLYIGTAKEIAERHGIKQRSVYHYQTPAYKKRMAQKNGKGNYITLIKLGDDDE